MEISKVSNSKFQASTTILNFNFESNTNIRVVLFDNEPWFVVADVSKVLSIKNVSDMLAKLDADEKWQITDPNTLDVNDANQSDTLLDIVSEAGLHILILKCRGATTHGSVPHRFRKWINHTVLPNIRNIDNSSQFSKPNESLVTALSALTKAVQDLAICLNSILQSSTMSPNMPSEQLPSILQNIPANQLPTIPQSTSTNQLVMTFINAWHVCLGAQDITSNELCRVIIDKQCLLLTEAAIGLFGSLEQVSSKKMSATLRTWSRSSFEGFCLLNMGRNKGGILWRLEQI